MVPIDALDSPLWFYWYSYNDCNIQPLHFHPPLVFILYQMGLSQAKCWHTYSYWYSLVIDYSLEWKNERMYIYTCILLHLVDPIDLKSP